MRSFKDVWQLTKSVKLEGYRKFLTKRMWNNRLKKDKINYYKISQKEKRNVLQWFFIINEQIRKSQLVMCIITKCFGDQFTLPSTGLLHPLPYSIQHTLCFYQICDVVLFSVLYWWLIFVLRSN